MTDLSILSQLPPKVSTAAAGTLLHAITSISEHALLNVQQIYRAPSLRDIARSLLASRLKDVLPVANPDIYFISRAGSSAVECSVTDGLLQALLQGPDTFEGNGVEVYTRHDTFTPEHQLPADNVAVIQDALKSLAGNLLQAYAASSQNWWQEGQEIAGTPGKFMSPHHQFAQRQTQALISEIHLQQFKEKLDAVQSSRLLRLATFKNSEGVFTPSIQARDGTSVKLQSCFVMTLQEDIGRSLTVETSTGAVFLVTPALGLEKFDSLTMLNQTLVKRMAMPERRQELINTLLLSDQARFKDDELATSDWVPDYWPLIEDIFDYRTFFLLHKQLQDLDFVVAQARLTGEDLPGFMRKVRDIECMKEFDEAMKSHVLALLAAEQPYALPGWLRHADEGDQDQFKRLVTDRERFEVQLQQQLETVDTLEQFSLRKIDAYIRQRLGYSVDPRQIFITVPDEIQMATGTYRCTYRKSLLEFAMGGLPEPVSATPRSIEVPEYAINPALTIEFVEALIEQLDVSHLYHQEVARVHRDRQARKTMLALRDRTIALNAFAARLQRHLQERGFALVEAMRADRSDAGVQRAMGGVVLEVGKSFFKDMIVFREITATDEFYVLYAPGAPAGWDMFEFPSWRSLALEIGSWTKTAAGTRYLIDQTSICGSSDSALFISQTHEKPAHWSVESVESVITEGLNYQDSLGQRVDQRTERYLAENNTTRNDAVEYTSRDCKDFALLNARIDEIKRAFLDLTPLVSYRDYVRARARKFISSNLANQGIDRDVDPDTVYFDLRNTTREPNPDFSPYSNLWTFTDLLMDGFSDRYEFTTKAVRYSSVGQDLTGISNVLIDEYLRGARLGEKYLEELKNNLLNPNHGDYPQRRALFAKQQQYEMHRAALSEYRKGTLARGEYKWIVDAIARLDKEGGEGGAESVNTLWLKGWRLEGLFVFSRGTDPEGAWVYTPDAPDGMWFRTPADVIVSMQRPGMAGYYYDRASYKGRRVIGTLVDQLARTPYVDNTLVTIDPVVPVDRIQSAYQLYGLMLERINQDVDDRTQSSNERLGLLIYKIVKVAGSVLLFPFPPASLAWGVLHSAIALQRGILAYVEGDRASALIFFAGAYVGALSAPMGIYEVRAGVSVFYPITGSVKEWVTGKAPFSTQWYPLIAGS